MTFSSYKTRPIRFLGIHTHSDAENGEWQIKIYGISVRKERVREEYIENAKQHLPIWLRNTRNYPLESYNIATCS